MEDPKRTRSNSVSALRKGSGLAFATAVSCAIAVSATSGCANNSDMSHGLLAHWKFEGDISDSSGRANDGVPRGDPEFVTGRIGKAVKFADDGQYAEIGKLASEVKQFTLAAWIHVDEMPEPETFASIYHNDGWKIGDVHLPFAGPEGIMDLGIKGNEPDMSIPSFRVSDLQKRWVHLAVSYDADDGKKVRFYLEGKPKDVFEITEANPVNLGPGRIGAWDEEGRWFKGLIDEMYIYERALEDSEIDALFKLARQSYSRTY